MNTYSLDLNASIEWVRSGKILAHPTESIWGLGCDAFNEDAVENLINLKKKYKFYVIEDASHAIGSSYGNIKVGSNKHSDLTVFSFQAVKVITSAEGGSVTPNNKKI